MIKHILMIDDDAEFLAAHAIRFRPKFSVVGAQNLQQASQILKNRKIDLITLDVHLGQDNGISFIQHLRKIREDIPIVMVSGDSNAKLIVQAIQLGANDYLKKPIDTSEFCATIQKIERHLARENTLHEECSKKDALFYRMKQLGKVDLLATRSESFQSLIEEISRVKGHNVNILIEGESGTGKDVVAKYLHSLEGDLDRPYVIQNCASIPENLFESEFFGHEKGAFSGAVKDKMGLLQVASGGDLFLDEINSLKYESQGKLLRALEDDKIRRIGGTKDIPVNFRLITATNFPLEKLVEEGKFREDLYHRLKVISLKIPPLRERKEDITILTELFLKEFSQNGQREISTEALQALKNYSWPGNVRELKNLIQRLVILVDAPVITVKDLPEFIPNQAPPVVDPVVKTLDAVMPLKKHMKTEEKEYIQRVLQENEYSRKQTAEQLKISPTSLYLKMKEYELLN